MDPDDHSIQLDQDLASIVLARDWVRRELCRREDADQERLEDALVMTSELVTNAILHAHSAPVLSIQWDEQRARIAVHDDDPNPPAIRDVSTTGGRGLRIVDAWAVDWGVDRVPDDGKTVWFTVEPR